MRPQVAAYINHTHPCIVKEAEEKCTALTSDIEKLPAIWEETNRRFSGEHPDMIKLLFVAASARIYSPVVFHGGFMKEGVSRHLKEIAGISTLPRVSQLISICKSYMKGQAFYNKVNQVVEFIREEAK